jgi:hypothetical protein
MLYLAKYFDGKKIYLLLHPMKIVPMRFLTLLAALFSMAISSAAPGPNGPPPPSPPPPPGLPIDSGIALLLAAALSYGTYKVYRHNTKTSR